MSEPAHANKSESGHWRDASALSDLETKGSILFRHQGHQVLLVATRKGVRAIENRCPHQGYPLSQGSIDPENCTLVCHWHNWRFRLSDGAAEVGEDAVRVFPTRVIEGRVEVDLAPPSPDALRRSVLPALEEALRYNRYEQVARELTRLDAGGVPLTDAVRATLSMVFEHLQWGMDHEIGGLAEALNRAAERPDDRARAIGAVLEALDYLAAEVRGMPQFPFATGSSPWSDAAFADAIEAEDEDRAARLIRGAIEGGLVWADLQPAFANAALAHFRSFGHPMIYTTKMGPLLAHLGADLTVPLALELVRALVNSTCEDRVPPFKRYDARLVESQAAGFGAGTVPDGGLAFLSMNPDRTMRAVTAVQATASARAIADALLEAAARNLLGYDLAHDRRPDLGPGDVIGWLHLTHGITVAEAGISLATQDPARWPAVLMQMAAMVGRTQRAVREEYARAPIALASDALESLKLQAEARLLDPGEARPIFSVHLLKTVHAVWNLMDDPECTPATRDALIAATGRYLNASPKRKHVRRAVFQAQSLVLRTKD